MPYLIDGHNLIPKIPGLSLEAPDDEMRLIQVLQDFCRLRRKQVEVYFDNAPPGQPRARRFGMVTAHFARSGSSADELIRQRLERLGGARRNWTVVSSDQQVQANARASRAQVLSSEAFARLLDEALRQAPAEAARDEEAALSEEEVDGWLRLFGEEEGEDGRL
jgi:predicted RNA-binding protein with PIN domain